MGRLGCWVRVIKSSKVIQLTWQARTNAFPGGSNYAVETLALRESHDSCDLRRATNDIIRLVTARTATRAHGQASRYVSKCKIHARKHNEASV